MGITFKEEFEEIQLKIKDVAKKLKESTKKLCRLFKENPDLEGDAKKVNEDRLDFITDMDNLIQSIKQGEYEEI